MSQYQQRQRARSGNGNAPKESKADPPEQVIRVGALKAAIWLNTTGEGDDKRPYRTVSIARSFQQDGQWAEQKISLYPGEVPTLAELLHEVMRRLFTMQAPEGEELSY